MFSLTNLTNKTCAGRFNRSAHGLRLGLLAAATSAALLPAPAQAQARYGQPVSGYQVQADRPLWTRGGTIGPEAETLLALIESADIDSLDPQVYRPRALAAAIDRARDGSPRALDRAESLLSRAFASYVRDVRAPSDIGMVYVDRALAPASPDADAVLAAAAAAPSLDRYLKSAGWMHPVYGQLRAAIADGRNGFLSDQRGSLLRINLDRARALPAPDVARRHILVDAAGARLWMYEGGRVVDTMRVVVGTSENQTPMMAGLIRFTTVNPYWNIPPDLVRERIATNVLDKGPSYLTAKRYQLLSDWSEEPTILRPSSIDWKAVAAGSQELRVRQLPGADNAMGKMKFMFPNQLGIYLHDTPQKDLLQEDVRQYSAGCVRVEDAARLAKWLYGKPLTTASKKPEQQVDLPTPVPVYITYLTAAPEGTGIAYRTDVYKRDGVLRAQARRSPFAAR